MGSVCDGSASVFLQEYMDMEHDLMTWGVGRKGTENRQVGFKEGGKIYVSNRIPESLPSSILVSS